MQAETDMRIGGRYRIVARSADDTHEVGGAYREIVPNEKLSFTWAWHESGSLDTPREHETTVTLEFKTVGKRTEMTLTQSRFRDTTGTANHHWGWTGSFEKLDAFLSRAA